MLHIAKRGDIWVVNCDNCGTSYGFDDSDEADDYVLQHRIQHEVAENAPYRIPLRLIR